MLRVAGGDKPGDYAMRFAPVTNVVCEGWNLSDFIEKSRISPEAVLVEPGGVEPPTS